MKLEEYAGFDGVGLSELVQKREISSLELAEVAALAIATVNGELNAVVEVWAPEARDLRNSSAQSALAGIPFLIKDLGISMAGRCCERGSRLSAGLVAAHDSPSMTTLREAGLVTIGRTTTPEFSFSTSSESVQQGNTRNPWDLSLSAGGSSGGAAAAVASGMVPIAHATDAGGSIRVPAALNGVFGFKQSRIRTSTSPAADELFSGFGKQLAVSRTVRDSAAMLDIFSAGHTHVEHGARRMNHYQQSVLRGPETQLKIGLMPHAWNGVSTNAEHVRAVQEVASVLTAMGHEVELANPPLGVDWEEFMQANTTIWTVSVGRSVSALAKSSGRPIDLSTLEPQTLGSYDHALKATASDYASALDCCDTMSRALDSWFRKFDVLLTPTLPEGAPRIGDYATGVDVNDANAWTRHLFQRASFSLPFNIAGLPVMSMPLATDKKGLPIGVQAASGFGRDALLLSLAGRLEEALPWRQRVPSVWAASTSSSTSQLQGSGTSRHASAAL